MLFKNGEGHPQYGMVGQHKSHFWAYFTKQKLFHIIIEEILIYSALPPKPSAGPLHGTSDIVQQSWVWFTGQECYLLFIVTLSFADTPRKLINIPRALGVI